MTDATYSQVRIVSARLLNPDTVERLLNLLFTSGGIRRVVLNGPRLPAVVPYGPAKGTPNPHTMRQAITVEGQEVQLEVHVGTVLLELESRDAIPTIKAACDSVFTNFTYTLTEGRYFKEEASISDYARYGPDADKDILGLSDPGSRKGPVIIQRVK
ncbi:MAG: methyl-coenzyme M reductase operon protein D [Methanoregulaceae archaeon]|nr:methyl-coenzyme M reductase operon protein D [Methanoregulaceae archaeon]